MEQAVGFTYNFGGFLFDESLRDVVPMTIFLQSWQLPVGKLASATTLVALFTQKRKKSNNDAQTFRCVASEGLSLYSLLGLWIQESVLPSGKATRACLAYLGACNLLDLLTTVVLGVVDPEDILFYLTKTLKQE